MSKSHTKKIISPSGCAATTAAAAAAGVVGGGGGGQAEVTQVALLRFHLLGSERDRDPDQTRPDWTRPVGITWQLSKLLTVHLPTGVEKRKN